MSQKIYDIQPVIKDFWDNEKYGDIESYTKDSNLIISIKCNKLCCNLHIINSSIETICSFKNIRDLCRGCTTSVCRCENKCNSFGKIYENVAKEWSPENKYDPCDLLPYSGRKVKWVCSIDKCKHKWTSSIINRTKNKTGCPKCKRSKLEKMTSQILNELKIDFVAEKKFKGCNGVYPLRFDIYIEQFDLCIELDGIQHFKNNMYFGGIKTFKKRILTDIYKNKFTKDNKINLLRISYNFNKKNKIRKIILNVIDVIKNNKTDSNIMIFSDKSMYDNVYESVENDFKDYEKIVKLSKDECRKIQSEKKKGKNNPNYGKEMLDSHTYNISKSTINKKRKITDSDIKLIRSNLNDNIPATMITSKFGYSKDIISNIKLGKILLSSEYTKEKFINLKNEKKKIKELKKTMTPKEIEQFAIERSAIKRRKISINEILKVLNMLIKGMTVTTILEFYKGLDSSTKITLDVIKNIKLEKKKLFKSEEKYNEYNKLFDKYTSVKNTDEIKKIKAINKSYKNAIGRRKASPNEIIEVLKISINTINRKETLNKIKEKFPDTKITEYNIKSIRSGRCKVLEIEADYNDYIKYYKLFKK